MSYTDNPPVAPTPGAAKDNSTPGLGDAEVADAVIGELTATQDAIDHGTGDVLTASKPLHYRLADLEAAGAGSLGGLTDYHNTLSVPPPRGAVPVFLGTGPSDFTLIDPNIFFGGSVPAQFTTWIDGTGGNNPVQIDTTGLPVATKNSAYTATLAASRGSTPYTWSIFTGTLQAGLTLHASTGVIDGTPTANSANVITFAIADSAGGTDFVTLTLTVADSTGAMTFDMPAALPNATIGAAYGPYDLDALYRRNGTGPFTYYPFTATPLASVSSTVATSRFSATAHGLTSGNGLAPSTAANGLTANQRYVAIVIDANTFQVANPATPGTPITLTGSDTSGITFNHTTAPNKGYSLSTAGVLSATNIAGSAGQVPVLSVQVTDSAGSPVTVTDTATITLVGGAGLTWVTNSLPVGTDGATYGGATLSVTGGTPPYLFSVKSGGTDAVHPYAGLTLVPFAVDQASCSATASNDQIAKTAHGFLDLQPVKVSAFAGSFAATGVSTGQVVFVKYIDADTFKIALTAGGTAIDITHDGTLTCSAIAGTIFGTPSGAGTPTVIFNVVDSATPQGNVDSGSIALTINASGSPLAFVMPDESPTLAQVYTAAAPLDTLAATGGTAPYTFTEMSTTLAAHGLSLNSSTGAITGTPTGTAGATFVVSVKATDSAGSPATVTDSGTFTLQSSATYSTQPNLKTFTSGGKSITIGKSPMLGGSVTRSQAADNLTVINAAITLAGSSADNANRKARIWLNGNDPTGHPYTETNKAVVCISGGSGVQIKKLRQVDLLNVWITKYDQEPIRASSHGYDGSLVTVEGIADPVVNICIDGNGKNQFYTDFSRASGLRYGNYCDGLYVHECGSSDGTPTGTIHGFKGNVTVKNTRGVTGASSTNQHGEITTECFQMVIHGGFGGDVFSYHGYYENLSSWHKDATYDSGDCTNSGPKFHYTQQQGNNPAPANYSPISVVTLTGGTNDGVGAYDVDSQRHGPGTFAGGRVQIISGFSANCPHNFNFEAGKQSSIDNSKYNANKPGGHGVCRTLAAILGDPTNTDYNQVWSINGGLGFQMNGHDTGVKTVDLYGFHSFHDNIVFEATGTASDHFKVYGAKVDSPDVGGGVTQLNGSANASSFFVVANGSNNSLEHLNGAPEKAGGNAEIGAQVDWHTYAGGT